MGGTRPYVDEFENKWNEYTGSHSIAVTSCTTALHLSCSARFKTK